jgi:hypothetical protein
MPRWWDWQAASTIVSGILAVLTLWIVLVNRRQVESSQEQVKASREQVAATLAQMKVSQDQIRQAAEAQYDNQRPLLVPDGVLPVKDAPSSYDIEDQHPWLDFEPSECVVTLANVGTGIALNVWGIIMGPEPGSVTSDYPQRYTLNVMPVLHCGPREVVKAPKAGPILLGTAMIGEHQLYAPKVPAHIDRFQKGTPVIVARLTLTYHDIFGHKHATIFDYLAWGQWRYVAFLRNIPEDLEDRYTEAIGRGVFNNDV